MARDHPAGQPAGRPARRHRSGGRHYTRASAGATDAATGGCPGPLPAGAASAYTQVALRFGVEVIPGDQMSPTGDDRRMLRLPYTAEPPVLTETIRRLALAWEAYAPSDAAGPPTRSVVV